MTVWPTSLTDLPALGLRVAAGRDGLDQRGPVSSAHVLDTVEPSPWLAGGEVIMIEPGLLSDDELVHRLVRLLVAGGASAVCVHAGDREVPEYESLVEACDEQMLPLLIVPDSLPFFAVARAITSAIETDHQRQLSHAVGLHRKVVEAVLRGGGPPEVLSTVGQAMEEPTLVAHDYAGVEIARFDPAGRLGGVPSTEISEAVTSGRRDLCGFQLVVEQVTQRTSVEASVGMILERQPEMYERLMLQQAAAGVSLDIARSESGRAANRKKVAALLEGATSRTASAMRLRKGLEGLGFPTETGWRLAVVTGADGAAKQDELTAAVENLYDPGRQPVVGMVDHGAVAIFGDDDEFTAALEEMISSPRWAGLRAGVSRPKNDGVRLAAAFREASVAVSLGKGRLTLVDSLGVKGLVAGLREELGAAELVRAVLGPLADQNQSIDLLETARSYFANACRAGPTAAELGIHRHTLTYRLERIEALTGLDPRDGENLLAFTLAIELLVAARGES